MTAKPLFDAYRDYLSLRSEPEILEWMERIDWSMSERNVAPVQKGAMRHLDGILEHVGPSEKRLVQTLIEFSPQAQWLQSYTADDFGEDFVANYGHVEIIGKRGHFACDDFAGGLVMFGPGQKYPNHWHVAEEIYFPLTNGSSWSRDNGPYQPRKSGEYIFHESNMAHAMDMGDAPLLALWLWHGGDLTQKADY